MLEQLKDFVRDREVGLGIIMIVAGTLVMFELAKFTGLGLMVYGLVQVFWGKEKIIQTIEEHHHHHHHNKPRKKYTPRKKQNG
jgi:uncharacterized membrane protein HdeD (DUF308 family)